MKKGEKRGRIMKPDETKIKPLRRKKLKASGFFHYADEYRKHITEEIEIEKIDMTPMFWRELYKIIDSGELINMNINAPPTFGKTVTAFAIGIEVMKEKFGTDFSLKDVDRDQQEFSVVMRNPNTKNTVRVIDEWNELETTGENSTVEQALYNYFSDVMAQRFIHKISCSPTATADKNAQIFLEVFSTDKINKINYCKLYYRLFSGGIDYKQLIGTVSIDVSKVLKKKWYLEYRKRKFEKMNLILQEGIFRPRVLEYADMILTVIERLTPLTKVSSLINANIVRNYVKMECRRRKIPLSIIGEELSTREVQGVLDLCKAYYKTMRGLGVLKDKSKRGDFKGGRKEIMETQFRITDEEKVAKEILNAITMQKQELERYKKINDKYNKKVN